MTTANYCIFMEMKVNTCFIIRVCLTKKQLVIRGDGLKWHHMSGVLGSIPGLATYFRLSFPFFKKGSCQLLAKVCARSTG